MSAPFDFDTSDPGDNDTISSYPADARAFRAEMEGWAGVEHEAASGRHKFGSGNDTARDAITDWATSGALWFSDTASSGATTVRRYLQLRISSAWYRLPDAWLDLAQSWTAAQSAAYSTITYAASVAPDLALSNFYKVTLTGNISFINPTKKPSAGSYVIEVTQDGTGSRTVTWSGSDYVFSFGSAPAATTTAGAIDLYYLTVRSDGKIHVSLGQDSKV